MQILRLYECTVILLPNCSVISKIYKSSQQYQTIRQPAGTESSLFQDMPSFVSPRDCLMSSVFCQILFLVAFSLTNKFSLLINSTQKYKNNCSIVLTLSWISSLDESWLNNSSKAQTFTFIKKSSSHTAFSCSSPCRL